MTAWTASSPSMFQSAPGGGAGGNHRSDRRRRARDHRFNPPPAVGPGETEKILPADGSESVFQSAPGGGAGGNPDIREAAMGMSMFQSAPGGGAGGNLVGRGA